MSKQPEILCIGEILWDSIPQGLFIGGAPFNVAGNLNSLGEAVSMISRIGEDELGRQVLRQLSYQKMGAQFIQIDDSYPTGIVNVDLTTPDNPGYEIVAPAAWDFIGIEGRLTAALEGSQMLIFGTLAQRGQRSRETIRRCASSGLLNVYDINLRPPFFDKSIVEKSLAAADIVKFNDDELVYLQKWFGLPDAPKDAIILLAQKFGCATVSMTRGEDGAVLWHNQQWGEHPGIRVTVKNTIGAGDAFLAGMLHGIRRGWRNSEILKFSCATGAYVAAAEGAIPRLDLKKIRRMTGAGK